MHPNSFSAQFTGFLKPATSGNYIFTADIDDAARLWIGGALVIDSWVCCVSSPPFFTLRPPSSLYMPPSANLNRTEVRRSPQTQLL